MKLGRTLALVVGAIVLPVVVDADEPADPYGPVTRDPETYTVYDAWNAPVFATGALVFVGSYSASVVIAGTSDHAGADQLYVPVVGPWLALNDWGECPIDELRCDRDTAQKVLLIADGVFHAAGVITMLSGIVSPSYRTIVASPRTVDKPKEKPKYTTRVKPTRNGFAVVGRF